MKGSGIVSPAGLRPAHFARGGLSKMLLGPSSRRARESVQDFGGNQETLQAKST